MLNHELMEAEGVLILSPEAPLEATDFEKLAQEVDPYIAANGNLHGLMIQAESFPGWKDFAALAAHLRFIKNHHQKIEKIAVVSDSSFLAHAPKLASHFIKAEIKCFSFSQKEEAFHWLTSDRRDASESSMSA